MKKLLCCAGLAVLTLAAVSPCLAATGDSPWNGTWKENAAKSRLSGDTVTYMMRGPGKFHYSNGGSVEYDFACDGKPYPTIGDRTITCTGTAAAGFDFVMAAHGTMLSKSHRTISPDGKMMMIHGTAMRPDGTSYDFDETMKRLTGFRGLNGMWLDVKEKSDAGNVMIMQVYNDMLHIEEPAQKEMIDAKLNGSDGKVNGPIIPPGASITYKPDGANRLDFSIKLKDKVLYQGTYTMSPDGKSFVASEWVPGRMSERDHVVYEKQ
jgi:hypothetical protein